MRGNRINLLINCDYYSMKNKLRILKAKIRANITNSTGWKTKRKLLIIESDDWGSIRIPSKQVYNDFVKRGYSIQNTVYNRFDSLASEKDLNYLLELLSSFKDIHGNPLKITANTIVANPDFAKIRDNDFKHYFYEPFTSTLARYPQHANSFNLWKDAINNNLFSPQFHGREHLNIILWMRELQANNKTIHYTFKQETTYSGKSDYSFMEAFDNKEEELGIHKQVIKEGLDLFEKIFGYRSKSFIAPCYVWHSDLNETLHENGINYIQGIRHQLEPSNEHFKYNHLPHILGEYNHHGQLYLIRNATFEPSSIEGMDWINFCLAQIETAFAWGKPAIITSHRVNYMGFLDEKNRDKNLKLLNELIIKVQNKWPEVEFISSDQLGDIIKESVHG